MAGWIARLTGSLALPTAFDPVTWHVHELLYGCLPAVVAGFLLTAVPNWTGRQPVAGAPLLALVLSWLAGRRGIAPEKLHPPYVLRRSKDIIEAAAAPECGEAQ